MMIRCLYHTLFSWNLIHKLVVLQCATSRSTRCMGGPNLHLWSNMLRRPSIIYALRRLGLLLRFLISTMASLGKSLKLRGLLVILRGMMTRKLVIVEFPPSIHRFSPSLFFKDNYYYEQFYYNYNN